MTPARVLEALLSNLATAKTGEVILRPSDVVEWPEGAFPALVAQQVIKSANPARSLDCDGCEMNCFMPVIFTPVIGNQQSRAFISCDKPVNIGRVPVHAERLRQWKISGLTLASALSRNLGMSTAPKLISESPFRIWNLGMVKGSAHRAELKFGITRNPFLEIGGQQRPFSEMVSLVEHGLEVNTVEILWLTDHPLASGEGTDYQPSKVKRESRKLDTQRMYSDWRRQAKAYQAKHPAASIRETALHISRQPEGKGKSGDTIRRHLQKKVG